MDDLLKEAAETLDSKVRLMLLAQAVNMAAQQRNFDRAITILDGFKDEDRKQLGEAWESWRWDFAAMAALAYVKKDDFSAANKVIDATPADLRPFSQAALAQKLDPKKYRLLSIELLRDAREGLGKSSAPEIAKAHSYIALSRLYAKHMLTDALDVLREAVTSINRAEPDRPAEKGKFGKNIEDNMDDSWKPLDLPAYLLEADEHTVWEIIASIKSPPQRVAARFGLLGSSLARIRTPMSVPKPKPTEMKGKQRVKQ